MSSLAPTLRRCVRCAAGASSSLPRQIAFAGPSRRTIHSSRTLGEQAKINTWFLDPSASAGAKAEPSTRQVDETDPAPESEPDAMTSANPSRRVFTTFDPLSTTSSPEAIPIPDLPTRFPAQLSPLHRFLTSPEEESADVLQAHSVQFFDTAAMDARLDHRGEGTLIRAGAGDPGTLDSAEDRGGNWDWVGVVVVKGRGRGIVARGDGVIRRWLLKHPLAPSIPPTPLQNPRTPRISPDADWSIIPLNLGTLDESGGVRACINVLSEEGKGRWGLEELFNASA
ncbi:hypothetical protein IAU60_002676 [Kwoniella sp. DSM 27419]